MIGAFEAAAVDLGVRLGWYRALADAAASAPELADRTGADARYAREWLGQRAVAGYLAVDDVTPAPDERRYSLPEEHRPVLVDELDPAFAAPLAHAAMAFTRNVPWPAEVYRSGGRTELGRDGSRRTASVSPSARRAAATACTRAHSRHDGFGFNRPGGDRESGE